MNHIGAIGIVEGVGTYPRWRGNSGWRGGNGVEEVLQIAGSRLMGVVHAVGCVVFGQTFTQRSILSGTAFSTLSGGFSGEGVFEWNGGGAGHLCLRCALEAYLLFWSSDSRDGSGRPRWGERR